MGLPFLDSPDPRRLARSRQIRAEAKGYFKVLETALPYYRMAGSLAPGAPLPELPNEPETLTWLNKVEQWGNVSLGTWMDQPKEFWEDIEAARVGRDAFRAEQVEHAATVSAPPSTPIVSR